MVTLIGGASHTGKTLLAQKLVKRCGHFCLSVDHLKMGLIRSGRTRLTPDSDDGKLTAFLWPVVREMMKTAIENGQNLIVEGCYIPFDWQIDFEEQYLCEIRHVWLIMSERYIREHFGAIRDHASTIEHRKDDGDFDLATALHDNAVMREGCERHHLRCLLIDDAYRVDPEELEW